MSSTHRPKFGAFFDFTSMSEVRWAQRQGLIAVAYRPGDRWDDSFDGRQLTPLTSPRMFVMQWQYSRWPSIVEPQRSAILKMYMFNFDPRSGRVYADAKRDPECNPAVYDCALPRNLWGACQHHLDPARNRTAADLAVAMSKEVDRVVQAGEPIPHQPVLPEFYLAFARPPRFERSPALRRETAAALGKPADHVTNAELEAYFWSRSFPVDDYTCIPQRYLAHQGQYLVHPVDGSPRPEGAGTTEGWQGEWYFDDGRWNPLAQQCDWPLVDMTNVLGRPFRNPAFTVLRNMGVVPANLTYPQFMKGRGMADFQGTLTSAVDTDETIVDVLVAMMRDQLGQIGELATDDDLKNALASPERPLRLSCVTGIWLARFTGLPRSEALSYRFDGCEVDLFTVKSAAWATRTAPVEPQESLNHGRTPAPTVG